MPVDIALHPMGNYIQGNLAPAPALPLLEGQVALAEGIDSQVLNVPDRGATLELVATAKLRMDVRNEAEVALLDPATSALVLGANERVFFYLPKGNYQLKTAVY